MNDSVFSRITCFTYQLIHKNAQKVVITCVIMTSEAQCLLFA